MLPEIPIEPQDASGSQAGKRTIPKFPNFRPKEPAPSQILVREPTCRNKTLDLPAPRHERQKSGKRHRERHAHTARTGRDKSPSSKSPGRAVQVVGETTIAFTVDRLGDPKNLTFGNLDRYATPSYFRFGAGGVVGSSQDKKIVPLLSDDKGVVLSVRQYGLPTKVDRRSLWKANQDVRRELKIKPQEKQAQGIDVAADFVTLNVAQRTKRRRVNELSSSDSSSPRDERTDYRSIRGRAQPSNNPADQDLVFHDGELSSDNQDESLPSTTSKCFQRERLYLSNRVDADPTSCDAWLALINHQDQLFGMNKASKRVSLTNAEMRSNADVKLSMYGKAMERVSSADGRETLLLGMMEEAIKVWPSEKLEAQWQVLLIENPGSLKLWTAFLDFKQTAFTSFRYQDVRNTYLNCFNMLQRAQETKGKPKTEKEEIYKIEMYILIRVTSFMRESGFSGLALAAWQAVLEYEFFRPTHIEDIEHKNASSHHETRIAMFEKFWDSEVPRIGEDNSKGWASFCERQGYPPEAITEATVETERVPDLWTSWVALECSRGLLARKPARTIDDVEDNDPYKVILFSDIRPFLIDSPSKSSQRLLIDAFLVFCHLQPCQAADVQSRLWTRDGFLRNELLHRPETGFQLWRLAAFKPSSELCGTLEDSTSSRSPFDFPLADYQPSTDTLFASSRSWFSPFDAWQDETRQSPLDTAWVLQALKALVYSAIGGDELAEFVLAMELRSFPDAVRKTARALLKKNSSNLRLYNAYALVEYGLGNPAKGDNVVVSAINMGKNAEDSAQYDSLLLWHTWIWRKFEVGRPQDSLKGLLAFGDGDVKFMPLEMAQSESRDTEPALLLRTEKALTATRDHLISSDIYDKAVLAMEGLILFSYLKNTPFSLSAAIATFKSNLALLYTKFAATSSAREHLHQSFAHLLYHHASHAHNFQPSELRTLLAESISQFPHNTIFLSLYAWNEARFRIDDRVRSIVNKTLLSSSTTSPSQPRRNHDSVTTHFFAIHNELHRPLPLGSNNSSIRSTFERAISSPSGAHCAALYKLYFLFERFRAGDIGRAKVVFWRGVRACPWVKELYMLALEHLRGVDGIYGMAEEELRGVYELMEEKELRIHVGMDEIFERKD